MGKVIMGFMADRLTARKTLGFCFIVQAIGTALVFFAASATIVMLFVIVYGLTVAGVTILRHRQPDRARPYRMWGYPATPWLFTVVAGWFVVNTWITQPRPSTGATRWTM